MATFYLRSTQVAKRMALKKEFDQIDPSNYAMYEADLMQDSHKGKKGKHEEK